MGFSPVDAARQGSIHPSLSRIFTGLPARDSRKAVPDVSNKVNRLGAICMTIILRTGQRLNDASITRSNNLPLSCLV